MVWTRTDNWVRSTIEFLRLWTRRKRVSACLTTIVIIWTRCPLEFKWNYRSRVNHCLRGSSSACEGMCFDFWQEDRACRHDWNTLYHHVSTCRNSKQGRGYNPAGPTKGPGPDVQRSDIHDDAVSLFSPRDFAANGQAPMSGLSAEEACCSMQTSPRLGPHWRRNACYSPNRGPSQIQAGPDPETTHKCFVPTYILHFPQKALNILQQRSKFWKIPP